MSQLKKNKHDLGGNAGKNLEQILSEQFKVIKNETLEESKEPQRVFDMGTSGLNKMSQLEHFEQ